MNTMIKKEYPESELTGKIIGCAMEVHKYLGNGFQEVVYQRVCLNPAALPLMSSILASRPAKSFWRGMEKLHTFYRKQITESCSPIF